MKDHSLQITRSQPYECVVGDYKFEKGRIPDSWSIAIDQKSQYCTMILKEWYKESKAEYLDRAVQIEKDRVDFKTLSIEYDGFSSVVTAIQEGTREEVTEAAFREITVHAKFFLGESADDIFDNIAVGGLER
jgi:hypothetical protein